MNFTDPICHLLHDRIAELLPFGFNFLWFRVVGNDYSRLATLLGYSYEELSDLIQFSALTSEKDYTVLEKWQNLLQIRVSINKYYARESDLNEKWISFEEDLTAPKQRRSSSKRENNQSSSSATNNEAAVAAFMKEALASTPLDKDFQYELEEIYLDNIARHRGLRRDRRLNSQIIDLIKTKQKPT